LQTLQNTVMKGSRKPYVIYRRVPLEWGPNPDIKSTLSFSCET